jgi:hypothetical protein
MQAEPDSIVPELPLAVAVTTTITTHHSPLTITCGRPRTGLRLTASLNKIFCQPQSEYDIK